MALSRIGRAGESEALWGEERRLAGRRRGRGGEGGRGRDEGRNGSRSPEPVERRRHHQEIAQPGRIHHAQTHQTHTSAANWPDARFLSLPVLIQNFLHTLSPVCVLCLLSRVRASPTGAIVAQRASNGRAGGLAQGVRRYVWEVHPPLRIDGLPSRSLAKAGPLPAADGLSPLLTASLTAGRTSTRRTQPLPMPRVEEQRQSPDRGARRGTGTLVALHAVLITDVRSVLPATKRLAEPASASCFSLSILAPLCPHPSPPPDTLTRSSRPRNAVAVRQAWTQPSASVNSVYAHFFTARRALAATRADLRISYSTGTPVLSSARSACALSQAAAVCPTDLSRYLLPACRRSSRVVPASCRHGGRGLAIKATLIVANLPSLGQQPYAVTYRTSRAEMSCSETRIVVSPGPLTFAFGGALVAVAVAGSSIPLHRSYHTRRALALSSRHKQLL
ncbi:hypothetical protein C8Q74DRAFT_908525 [Fomes fomentarius]|nr:hypothetical protein C8Q74DRAFT_908525 [Fomes fomentarius]